MITLADLRAVAHHRPPAPIQSLGGFVSLKAAIVSLGYSPKSVSNTAFAVSRCEKAGYQVVKINGRYQVKT